MLGIVIVNFIVYYLASLQRNLSFKVGLCFLFVLSTILLRFTVNNSELPDYDAYYSVIGLIEPEISFKTLFSEPYYFQLVNYLNQSYSTEIAINFFYKSSPRFFNQFLMY